MEISSRLDGGWQAAQLRRLYRAIFHDASNPIGGALGCLQALQAGLIEDDELQTYLALVQEGLEKVHQLTAAFHRFVLPTESAPEPVGLGRALEYAHLLVKKGAGEARVTLVNEVSAVTVCGGDVACLHVAVHCLEMLVALQGAGSTIRAELAEVDDWAQVTFAGSIVGDPAGEFPPGMVSVVTDICAVHGARAHFHPAENRVVVDWQIWSA